VLLGPTQDRVARHLAERTRYGRVVVHMPTLATTLGLERSEAYRITARLRVLGLFGIEDDQGGTVGGRRVWRTAIAHDGPRLDPARHRETWRRILGWARHRSERVAARLAALRPTTSGEAGLVRRSLGSLPASGPPGAGSEFGDAMRRHGLGSLIDSWRPR